MDLTQGILKFSYFRKLNPMGNLRNFIMPGIWIGYATAFRFDFYAF